MSDLLALIQPILDRTEGQIGTHSDRCFEYHVGCLAALVKARLTPVVVSTVEELNALPVGSVVRKAPEDSERTQNEDGSWGRGAVAELRADVVGVPAWFMVGSYLGFRSHQADLLPARVLFRPDTEGEPR